LSSTLSWIEIFRKNDSTLAEMLTAQQQHDKSKTPAGGKSALGALLEG
jgi:hypothetical protein